LIKIMLFLSIHMSGRYTISLFCVSIVIVPSTSAVPFGHMSMLVHCKRFSEGIAYFPFEL